MLGIYDNDMRCDNATRVLQVNDVSAEAKSHHLKSVEVVEVYMKIF